MVQRISSDHGGQWEFKQQSEGRDYFLLLCSCEATYGVVGDLQGMGAPQEPGAVGGLPGWQSRTW